MSRRKFLPSFSVTFGTMSPTGEMFPIQGSSLYHIWMEERLEIGKNKWYLSEKAGHDVGWERAKWDWDMRFRANWLRGLRESGRYPD